jgi:hypothetical protein
MSEALNEPPPPYRVRTLDYTAQVPITIKPEPNTSGFVVYLNIGSEGNEQKLLRSFQVYSEVLPDGIRFTPPSDGMVIVDINSGVELPPDDILIAAIAAAKTDFANASPAGFRRRPPG